MRRELQLVLVLALWPLIGAQLVASPDAIPFEDAVSFCYTQDLRLARIEDEEINLYVAAYVKLSDRGHHWINANDLYSPGTFVNDDNEPLNYTNFAPNHTHNQGLHPNCIPIEVDEVRTENDCEKNLASKHIRNLELYPNCVSIGPDGFWTGNDCDKKLPALCGPKGGIRQEKEYKVFQEKVSQVESIERCQREGMRLATISNIDELNQLGVLARASSIDSIWMNYSNRGRRSDTFMTEDGQPLAFGTWRGGKPQIGPDVEKCVLLSAPVQEYVPYDCSTKWPFVCEKYKT